MLRTSPQDDRVLKSYRLNYLLFQFGIIPILNKLWYIYGMRFENLNAKISGHV